MESTGTGIVGQDARPFSAQVHLQDEEKVPLQNSLPRSFGKADYTHSSSEHDPHGLETSTRKERDADSPDRKYSWNSGIFTRFPFLGVLPLLLSVACKLFPSYFDFQTNGQLVSEWSGVMQPAVLLAYTSTVANAFIGIAFAYGCAVSFWVQAVEGHMPVTNLHRNWEGATSFWGALNALTRRKAIRISLVSVLVTISSLLRGPLMQRASSTHSREVALTGIVDLQVAPKIWVYGEGAFRQLGSLKNLETGFSSVLRDYQSKAPIRILGAEACNNCSLTVEAFGFDSWHCSLVDEEILPEPTEINDGSTTPNATKLFQIYIGQISPVGEPMEHDEGALEVTVLRKVSEGGNAKSLYQSCVLKPAIMHYNLTLDGGYATFASKSWKNDSTRVAYNSLAAYLYMQEYGEDDYISGPDYDDPMDDIINGYREIALRMSILEAVVNNQNLTRDPKEKPWISQPVDYVSHQVRVEYKANPHALALAVVISLLGPLATLTLFWGYWKLGRDFSMSPLELANSFRVHGPMLPMPGAVAPSSSAHQNHQDHGSRIQHQHQPELAILLANCSSNASAKKITKHCARKRKDGRWWTTFFRSSGREPKLQYGVLESTGQLGFAVEDEQGVIHARKPREGELL
ncbi:hypothetical protein QBC32DRAFT_224821 [Pseudoneurospora amorphoporcata]|uniref:Uncharacterized protein n=1 Tax=Pseudoneurospora amorphoporcata TaxID=241081 RepID=A0AAN6NNY9_9PEZI|nr:hypothetical protein QBC32DRAFT_224821 [Pseudoneurospora amorphoporcata]